MDIQHLYGRTYSGRTILYEVAPAAGGARQVRFRCHCGQEGTCHLSQLLWLSFKKCAACRPRTNVGDRFGCWTVLSKAGHVGTNTFMICQCDCGNICKLTTSNLRSGQSAGCEKCKQARLHPDAAFNKKHRSAIKFWKLNRDRLCDEWKNDRNLFISEIGKWRRSKVPQPINPNNPIGPANYKWRHPQTGKRFKPRRLYTINGVARSAREWMDILHLTSRERIRQLDNEQRGLCRCGEPLPPGRSICDRHYQPTGGRRGRPRKSPPILLAETQQGIPENQ